MRGFLLFLFACQSSLYIDREPKQEVAEDIVWRGLFSECAAPPFIGWVEDVDVGHYYYAGRSAAVLNWDQSFSGSYYAWALRHEHRWLVDKSYILNSDDWFKIANANEVLRLHGL